MPNHVRNIVKISGLTEEKKLMILKELTNFDPENPLEETSHIDFDKIIPEPKTKAECPDEHIVTIDSHVETDEAKPWFDWYSWHNAYWGTKWNAYDGYTIIGKTYITFVFSTAWSAPDPIYLELRKSLHDYKIEIKWADEDIGSNCGRAVYDPTDHLEGYIVTHGDTMPDSRSFARSVWKY